MTLCAGMAHWVNPLTENCRPANYNMDGQLVLAGLKADLESLVDTFKAAGAKRALVLDMTV